MKTFRQLLVEKQLAQDSVTAINMQLQRLPGAHFIQAVENQLERDLLAVPTQLLIAELNQREEPMSHAEITQIFRSSGYEFTEADINACTPDSAEAIADQLTYYKE